MANKKNKNYKKLKKNQTLARKDSRKNSEIVAEIEAMQEADQTKVKQRWEEIDWLRRYLDFIESLD